MKFYLFTQFTNLLQYFSLVFYCALTFEFCVMFVHLLYYWVVSKVENCPTPLAISRWSG